ncbi:MAG: hypothetical protein SF187_17950 [Deltaproteobacteria bacterium]|nr:hypothetical protein [Deltaproteobacteria bacterium]
MTTGLASVWRLVRVLVRFRLRHTWHSFRRGGHSGSRWLGVVALLLPLTYVGLFISAFGVVAQVAPWPVQAATLSVVVWGLTLASLMSKITGGDAVVAGTGENEFFLARPVSLPALVAARAFASAILDFWGSLFLLPVLAAAAYVWRLGARGFVMALAISVIVQISLTGCGQCVSLGLLGRVPLRRRRALATAFGLVSALAVAMLWALASFVLRQPQQFVQVVSPYAGFLNHTSLMILCNPLLALRAGGAQATVWLLALVGFALASVVGAAGVAAWSSRRGWQDAGLPYDTESLSPRTGAALSIAGKEWRMLVRDRARFVSLLAMPFLFVGVQLFGAVGMDALGTGPRRAGLVAYSLAAYLATLGPLPHMQGERRAFWILRSVPVPLWRLMWGKARAWLWIIVGVGLLAYAAMTVLGGDSLRDVELWRTLALVVFGSGLLCVLAVGVGCNAADLSDDGRNALGPGTVYVFLMVAGLFNVALLRDGVLAARTLVLYATAVGLVWSTGVHRAESALDPGRPRPLTTGDGALACVLLFCGVQLLVAAPAGLSVQESQMGAAVWAALVGLGVWLFLVSIRRGLRRRGEAVPALLANWRGQALLRSFGALVFAGAACAGLRVYGGAAPAPLVMVCSEELILRALLARSLQQRFGWSWRTVAVATFVSVVANTSALSWPVMAVQFVSVLAFAASRSVLPAVIGRMLMFVV